MSKTLYQKALINIAFALLLATPIATALSRNAAFPLLLVVALLLTVAVALQNEGTKKLSDVGRWIFRFRLHAPAFAIALAIIVLALVSLLWSPAPGRGLAALAGASTAALVSVYCCVLLARHIDTPTWLAWALPLAVSAGCLLVYSELTLSSPIRAALGASTEGFRLNRAAVSVALMLPILFLFGPSRNRVLLNLAFLVLVWVTVFKSESESAKLAAIVVTGVLVITPFVSSRWLVISLGISVIATHIFAPFFATALYNFTPRDIVSSLSWALAEHPFHFVRIEIWWAHAQQVINAPFFGHGVQASFYSDQQYIGSDPIMLRVLAYVHPHNVSIQVWYELGLIGVMLSAILMGFLFKCILLLSDNHQKLAVVVITGVWLVAYVSHGAWQHWWWALVGVLAVLFCALNKLEYHLR